MSSLLDILNKSVNYLEKKNVSNSRLTVEKILAEVLSIQRIMLYANFDKMLTEEELSQIREKLNEAIEERQNDTFKQSEGKHTIYSQNTQNPNIQNSNTQNYNIKTLLDKSIVYLDKHDILECQLIAEIIFSHVLEIDRMMLFTKYKDEIEPEKVEKIRKYIQKVGKEKFPVQYLLNEQQFYGRNFYVNKGVLIPRQDTEILVEHAIEILKKESDEKNIEVPKVLDIGTGSGVIGITVALEIPQSKVIGIDISDRALEISEKNKEILKADNIKFFKSNLFESIEYKKFNMIISNPPYISRDEIGVMSDDALLHEPDEALFAENEGLYFYYEISSQAMEYLRTDGYLLFEIGYKQGNAVKSIMEQIGYENIVIIQDMQGLDRVIIGQKTIEINLEKESE